jgi:hypothetical protein
MHGNPPCICVAGSYASLPTREHLGEHHAVVATLLDTDADVGEVRAKLFARWPGEFMRAVWAPVTEELPAMFSPAVRLETTNCCIIEKGEP